MGRPHPIELRERVVAFVEDGHTHRAAAAHFRVSPRFVNNMVIVKRESGSLAAKRQGNRGVGKLRDHGAWVRQRVEENGDLTLDELRLELAERDVIVHRSSVGRLLHRLGLSHKKKPAGQRAAAPRYQPSTRSVDERPAAILQQGPATARLHR